MTDTKSQAAQSGQSEPPISTAAERRQSLALTFVELADTMVADFDLLDFLHVLTERSVTFLDADAAGLVLADQRGHLRVLASTSETSRLLELFELQNAEGPCLDSYLSGEQVVNVGITEARERWPVFAPEAASAGFVSVHALPLRLRGTVIGAINLFCRTHATLGPEDIAVGQALADVATIGMLSQRSELDSRILAETLQDAINGRIVIEQAKGVIAELVNVDMDGAFSRLRRYAHDHGAKLTAIASDIIDGSMSPDALNRPESQS